MAIDIEKIEEKKEKEEKDKGKLSVFSKIQIYIIPLVGIILFFVSVFFLVVPSIGRLFNNLGEISDLNEELDLKRDELTGVIALSNNQTILNQDLNIINNVTSTNGNSDVSGFQERIKQLSQQTGLGTPSQSLNEIRNSPEIFGKEYLLVREVPNDFEIAGSYNNLINFITRLNTLDDLVIVTEMELTQREDDLATNQWILNLVLTKYQFTEEDQQQLENAYLAIPYSAQVSDSVRGYLDRRK